jgi:hypothetical protein
MFAIHNGMPHPIDSNEHITTAVQQAASGSQSCINMSDVADTLKYQNVYMCAAHKKVDAIM